MCHTILALCLAWFPRHVFHSPIMPRLASREGFVPFAPTVLTLVCRPIDGHNTHLHTPPWSGACHSAPAVFPKKSLAVLASLTSLLRRSYGPATSNATNVR
eukprot:48062-Amphidinium_carterae.1